MAAYLAPADPPCSSTESQRPTRYAPLGVVAADTAPGTLKANRVSGVGISEYLVVQRKDISDDSHTSAPDWLRAEGIAKPFISCSFAGIGQIQPGKMPNLHISSNSSGAHI